MLLNWQHFSNQICSKETPKIVAKLGINTKLGQKQIVNMLIVPHVYFF